MKEVFVVTGKGCKYCPLQKKWLDDAGIKYTELDVEKNSEFVSKLGLMGLPMTVIMKKDKVIHAYSGTIRAKEVKELLED